ncbi:HNH endonuclease [Streptomyces olivaceus]
MAVSKRLRYEILRRDNHACRYCGATAPAVKLAVDHVIPQSLGGSDKPDNLVASCTDCNAGKTSSMPNAQPVADVDQETFRQSAERKQAAVQAEADRLWNGHAPSSWDENDYWRYTAEASWYHAWTIATDGEGPPLKAYDLFLEQRNSLESQGRGPEEIACAAVIAGAAQTAILSWGLSIAQARHAGISGEQFSRMDGVRMAWVDAWLQLHGDTPTEELDNEFNGRLVMAVHLGYTRDQLMRAIRSAAMGRTADVDYFAYHIACQDTDEKVGEV